MYWALQLSEQLFIGSYSVLISGKCVKLLLLPAINDILFYPPRLHACSCKYISHQHPQNNRMQDAILSQIRPSSKAQRPQTLLRDDND